jgi:regulator of sirC expression with transglutaminase-like and TPR domain
VGTLDDSGEDLHRFETPDEAFQYIRYAGMQKDAEMDLGETALALALLFLPGVNPDRYRHHLRRMCTQLEETYAQLRKGGEETLALRVEAIRRVVHGLNEYKGDQEHYDDLQNANLIRVIERRRGLPIAIGILYIVIARAAKWQIDGLAFPGHFLVRLDMDGARVILDPFRDGQEMNAAELRQLLKSIAGEKAELSHHFYNPAGTRDVLLRLENNLKKRLIDNADYAQAIVVAEAMEALAPDEYRIFFDKGVLYAKLGQKAQAIQAIEQYIVRAPDARDRQQAQGLLQQIHMMPD